MRPSWYLVCLCLFAGVPIALGQTSAPAPIERDPQAVTLANSAYQALTGSTVLQDLTLQATATWVAGSDQESGTATLEGKGSQESKVVLGLSDGQHQEIRNFGFLSTATSDLTSPPGAWSGTDGVWHAEALHNCWTDASWFYPGFALQSALNDNSISLVYAGLDSFEGVTVADLILYRTPLGQSAAATIIIQRLSAVHLYLDPTSALPVGLEFNAHPDIDGNSNIPVEIRFSDYRSVNGVQIPFRVQKFLQGSLLLDLATSAVLVNSGLTDSDFVVPTTVVSAGGAR